MSHDEQEVAIGKLVNDYVAVKREHVALSSELARIGEKMLLIGSWLKEPLGTEPVGFGEMDVLVGSRVVAQIKDLQRLNLKKTEMEQRLKAIGVI